MTWQLQDDCGRDRFYGADPIRFISPITHQESSFDVKLGFSTSRVYKEDDFNTLHYIICLQLHEYETSQPREGVTELSRPTPKVNTYVQN